MCVGDARTSERLGGATCVLACVASDLALSNAEQEVCERCLDVRHLLFRSKQLLVDIRTRTAGKIPVLRGIA